MIQGRFDIKTFDTPGLTSEKLEELLGPRNKRKPCAFDRLMKQWNVAQAVEGSNIVFDGFTAYSFHHAFQEGLSKIGLTDPWDTGSTGACAAFSTLAWETTDAEPTYQEHANYTGEARYTTGIVAQGAFKRFVEDDIEAFLISSDPYGRESISFRSRWLWLPSNFSSSNIRSLAAWYSWDADSGGYGARARMSRIRLKDSAGNPVILTKTSSQTLFAEYTVTLVSV